MHKKIFTLKLGEKELCRDITPDIQAILDSWHIEDGLIYIAVRHTTCRLLIQEYESGLIKDLYVRLGVIAPHSERIPRDQVHSPLAYYLHDDSSVRTENLEEDGEERINGHSHTRASFMGSRSEIVEVEGGILGLGKWERILFFDYDDIQHRQERTISVKFGQLI